MQKSLSYILKDVPVASLHSDTRFFTLMGEGNLKFSYFRAFVPAMQKHGPSFGKGCYVNSTSLPNDIENNLLNALCRHGVVFSEVLTWLNLVLDEGTGLPVRCDIIPGNVLYTNTVLMIINDVADTLGIAINSLVLYSGYVSRELIGTFHIGTEKSITGRMPTRKGYPYKIPYWEVKDLIGIGKYAFVRKHHAFLGIKKQITLF